MVYGFDIEQKKLYAYPDRKTAQSYGNGVVLFETAKDIETHSLSSLWIMNNWAKNLSEKNENFGDCRDLANFFINYAGKNAIKRGFDTEQETETVNIRAKIPETKAKFIKGYSKTNTSSALDVALARIKELETTVAKLTTKKPVRNKRGRVSAFEGKRIFSAVTENPRRETETVPSGYHSMQIIMKAGKRGIKYDDFIAKGGRSVDLSWDMDHGHITTS